MKSATFIRKYERLSQERPLEEPLKWPKIQTTFPHNFCLTAMINHSTSQLQYISLPQVFPWGGGGGGQVPVD